MKTPLVILATVASSLAFAACGSPGADAGDVHDRLRAATVAAIGDHIAADAVTISEISSSLTRIEWRAATPGGDYVCDADAPLTLPSCTPAAG